MSSLVNIGSSEPKVIPLCYEMICSSRSLTIKIGEYYIVCPREGGKIKAKNFDGFLLCPDYNLILQVVLYVIIFWIALIKNL